MTDTILQPLFALFAWIGAVVIGAGTLGIVVYHVFKFLGEKWLTAKFGERLEAFKHAQQKELEELKFKINRLMDRTVKLHQREFDVLPEVWGRLSDAFKAAHPVSLGILEYADVNKMPAEQLEEFLAKTPLTEWQKSELKKAGDKTRYYGDTVAWHEMNRAYDAYREFHVYLSKNGIFTPDIIKNKFLELDDMMFQALFERRYSLQNCNQATQFEKGRVLHEKGPQLVKALEEDVQARLWSSEALETLEKK